MSRIGLPVIVKRLQGRFGTQTPPKLSGPWEMILWENVAYLADDDRRAAAFRLLKKSVGVAARRIDAATDEALLAVTRHGILPATFVRKLRQCARITLGEFAGNLRPVLKLPVARAMQGLRKFPGIGAPGAEKILLFTKSQPILALESNGLRVLVRLGYGRQDKDYAKTYRLVRQALPDPGADYALLMQAHLLLRRHGKEICRSSEPRCDQCPLAPDCAYYRKRRQSA